MSQKDLDDVRDAWAAISDKDFERFVSHIDPDVEFTSLVAEADAATDRGHAGARRWWNSVHETFPDFWAQIIDLREEGEQIIAQIRLCATVRGTRIEQTIWQVLTVRGDYVIRWTVHRTEEEALREVSQLARSARYERL
jgi:ketosteroid isomerase-like protein